MTSIEPIASDRPESPESMSAAEAGPLRDRWREAFAVMDFAFQPIVNIHTGACYGYEALLRNVDGAGFVSPQHVFETAHAERRLAEVEMLARAKAIGKFSQLPNRARAKLFLNIDNRILVRGLDLHGPTRHLAEAHGLPLSAIVFEISEQQPLGHSAETLPILDAFRRHGFRIAIDDFGTGFSGLQMLYFAEPDVLKIDRFFISDIAADSRKKVFLTQIANIAHLLGVVVLAEGVESEREYYVCKEIGCDLIQGYLVQRPTVDIGQLRDSYDEIAVLGRRERRSDTSDQRLLEAQIDPIEPLALDAGMEEVFERFRCDKASTFFPVVDDCGEPVGIVRERELKEYAYSQYGQALMTNKTFGRKLRDIVVRCPVADINSKAENILQAYSAVDASDGIIIVDTMKYVGFLSARSLLRVINEKNLAAAREQNPLTRLPGNNSIHAYVSEALAETGTERVLAYFDFDNFKPFNDHYGFRLGDRAILLFAELMTKVLPCGEHFIGHVGGDDFFAGFRGLSLDECEGEIRDLIARFGHEVESFYDEETRRQGYMTGYDRVGAKCSFPLLGVSAALVRLPAGREIVGVDALSRLIACHKKKAKASRDRVSVAVATR